MSIILRGLNSCLIYRILQIWSRATYFYFQNWKRHLPGGYLSRMGSYYRNQGLLRPPPEIIVFNQVKFVEAYEGLGYRAKSDYVEK